MSELSEKRVRTSLKAIAQSKRAFILNSSLSERCIHVKFFGGSIQYKKILSNEPVPHYWKQDTWLISILFPTSRLSQNVCWGTTYGKLQKIATWFRANKMAVNTSKTKFIVFEHEVKQ